MGCLSIFLLVQYFSLKGTLLLQQVILINGIFIKIDASKYEHSSEYVLSSKKYKIFPRKIVSSETDFWSVESLKKDLK